MIDILLGIIGCYGAAAAAVHLAGLVLARMPRPDKHYILMTRNDESQLEGCIRSLYRFSRQTGTPIRITVCDRGSTDDTAAIAKRCGTEVILVRIPDQGNADRRCNPEEQMAWGFGADERESLEDKTAVCSEAIELISPEGNKGPEAKPSAAEEAESNGRDKLLWCLRSHGIVREQDHPVVVDLEYLEDWFKLPF